MKITAIEVVHEQFELSRPYAISFRDMTNAVSNIIVRIITDSGEVGLGAASPEHFVTGESLENCLDALDESHTEWMIGSDVRTLPALTRELARRAPTAPAARAAIDIALHDLLAKALGVPVVEMLGRAHDGLPTSITIGIKSLRETLEEADEYLGRGFKILKVKIGNNLEQDIERLVRLREQVGRRMKIRVDPNQGYSAEQLTDFVARTEDLDIEFFEQPMKAADVDAMRNMPESIRDLIAADETLLRESDALNLVAPPRACGIFNIKLMKCGGIWPGMRIAAVAETAGIELMWGCMDESCISIAGALHAALASPATRYLDLDGSLDLVRDVAQGGFTIKDGVMRTIDKPGLGVYTLD